jgi:hypothetical protein
MLENMERRFFIEDQANTRFGLYQEASFGDRDARRGDPVEMESKRSVADAGRCEGAQETSELAKYCYSQKQ